MKHSPHRQAFAVVALSAVVPIAAAAQQSSATNPVTENSASASVATLPSLEVAKNSTDAKPSSGESGSVTVMIGSFHINEAPGTHYNGKNPGLTYLEHLKGLKGRVDVGGLLFYNSLEKVSFGPGAEVNIFTKSGKWGKASLSTDFAVLTGYDHKLDALNPFVLAFDAKFFPVTSHTGLDVKLVPWKPGDHGSVGVLNFGVAHSFDSFGLFHKNGMLHSLFPHGEKDKYDLSSDQKAALSGSGRPDPHGKMGFLKRVQQYAQQ